MTPNDLQTSPPVCDYEGSGYREDFWLNQGRDYEDRVERAVLRRLLPGQGRRVLEIGAGFGRLTNELAGTAGGAARLFASLLAEARARLGDERYTYVAADIYHMPFPPGVFDAATMIRVIHHIADVPVALNQIRAALAPSATFVLEYANKRNLKALVRHALGRQERDPNTLDPVEFVPLNFDFHPTYMQVAVRDAGFRVEARVPVSFFRLGVFKRLMPTGLLVGLDTLMQGTGLLYAPSIFTRNTAIGGGPDATPRR